MFRKSLVNVGLRVHRPHHEGIQRVTVNYGDIRRRDASSTTTTTTSIMADNAKLKTIDDLDGPNLMTTLNWLFVKGYFQTTQQMQVSEKGGDEERAALCPARDRCVCTPSPICRSVCLPFIWPIVHLCSASTLGARQVMLGSNGESSIPRITKKTTQFLTDVGSRALVFASLFLDPMEMNWTEFYSWQLHKKIFFSRIYFQKYFQRCPRYPWSSTELTVDSYRVTVSAAQSSSSESKVQVGHCVLNLTK